MSTSTVAQKAAMEGTTAAAAASSGASSAGSVATVALATMAAGSTLAFLPKSVLAELLTSGISVGTANTITNPLDMVKVRLQLERNKVAEGAKPPGMIQTGINVVRNEGVLALWSGLGPSLARGFFFGGARLGLYTPIKNAIAGEGKVTLDQKIAAGSLSGGVAAAVTSPIELVKTRLQAAGRTPGAQRTSMGVIKSVIETDGVVGLWKGAMPGLVRSAVLTAAQCATYDEIKRYVLAYSGWSDGTVTHLTSSMLTGLISTTITNPIDVVKTRMFMGGSKYKNAFQCAGDVLRKDGAMGFMKGWSASYARLGPHTIIMFLTAERLRKYAGLQSF